MEYSPLGASARNTYECLRNHRSFALSLSVTCELELTDSWTTTTLPYMTERVNLEDGREEWNEYHQYYNWTLQIKLLKQLVT